MIQMQKMKNAGLQMKIHINQIDLFFEQEGEGLPILLMHGYPLDHTIWDTIRPALADKCRVITPDLRGHGRSDAPEGIYTMHLMAEDMVGLLDALEIERAIVIGHSMGGYTTLAFARGFADRLAGIGFIASHARADTVEGRQGRQDMAKKVLVSGMDQIAETMPSKLTSRQEFHAYLRSLMMNTNPIGATGTLLGMAERPDSTPYLSQIAVPSLVVAGGADGLIPMEWSQDMAGKLASCRLWVFPEAGHMPMLENPDQTVEAILDLVSRVNGKK
jgi:3-oxoadipate enol-lactonase